MTKHAKGSMPSGIIREALNFGQQYKLAEEMKKSYVELGYDNVKYAEHVKIVFKNHADMQNIKATHIATILKHLGIPANRPRFVKKADPCDSTAMARLATCEETLLTVRRRLALLEEQFNKLCKQLGETV